MKDLMFKESCSNQTSAKSVSHLTTKTPTILRERSGKDWERKLQTFSKAIQNRYKFKTKLCL